VALSSLVARNRLYVRRVQSLVNPLHKELHHETFNKDIEPMDDLLLHGLKDMYYAENEIVKSLPKLIEKATNRDLIERPQGPPGGDQKTGRPA
jgi:Domain of unknown function (DUF892)